jgi:hypothetical protein
MYVSREITMHSKGDSTGCEDGRAARSSLRVRPEAPFDVPKGRQTETKHGEFLVTEIEGAVEVPLHLPSAILGALHVGKEMHCRKAHEPDTFRKLRS